MATTTTEPVPSEAKKARTAPKPKPSKPAAVKTAATPKTATWASPVKPSLVLLPPKSRGLKARRQATRRAIIMSLGLIGVTAAAYVGVLAGTAGAQAELNKEKSVTSNLTAFLMENRDVQEYSEGFVGRQAAASAALEQDVAYSRALQALQSANAVGAVFTSIKSADPGAPCQSPSPFAASASLGCLDVAGTAKSVEDIATLVAALNRDQKILTEPYLTSSTSGDDGISFKLSVGFTSEALSLKGQKFDPQAEDTAPGAASETAPETQGANK